MIVFMLFIIGMVVYMFKIQDRDSLVEEDYYEKGINYDHEYEAKRNTLIDKAEPEISVRASELLIKLKDGDTYQLKLLRPTSAKQDIFKEGELVGGNHTIIIDITKLEKGLWSLKLAWQNQQGKHYLYTKDITL